MKKDNHQSGEEMTKDNHQSGEEMTKEEIKKRRMSRKDDIGTSVLIALEERCVCWNKSITEDERASCGLCGGLGFYPTYTGKVILQFIRFYDGLKL